MGTAEERLRTGEYFWAERRFVRALRFVPDHPLASAGLGHAQLGAGLYGSAALTLRSLLQRHPELIDATYDEGLLPNRVRLLESIEEIRFGPLAAEEPAASGFLLAYIGHQMQDRALVEAGLGLMAEDDAENQLLQLLRTVWLAE